MSPTVPGLSPLQADGLSTSMSAMRHPPCSPAFDIELLLQHVLFLSFAVSQNDIDAPSTAPVATTTHGHAFHPSLSLYICRQQQANSDLRDLSVIYPLKRFYIRLQKCTAKELEPATFVLNCSINNVFKDI